MIAARGESVRIQVQLFATLSRYLPGASATHGATVDVPDGSTIRDVLARLGIPHEVPVITLLNGRDAGHEETLKESDTLTMFPPLAGGA